MSTTQRRPRRKPGENRERLLEAGLIEFGLFGYHGASTSAIAARAGVPQPHVYASFATKRELFLACCVRTLSDPSPRPPGTSADGARNAEGTGGAGRTGSADGARSADGTGSAGGTRSAANPAEHDAYADETRARLILQAFAASRDPQLADALQPLLRRFVDDAGGETAQILATAAVTLLDSYEAGPSFSSPREN